MLAELLARAKRAHEEPERSKLDQKQDEVQERVTKVDKRVTEELEDPNFGTIL